MQVRFEFKSFAEAQKVADKLPLRCNYQILTDRTKHAYLEVNEKYEEYIEKHLIPKSLTGK